MLYPIVITCLFSYCLVLDSRTHVSRNTTPIFLGSQASQTHLIEFSQTPTRNVCLINAGLITSKKKSDVRNGTSLDMFCLQGKIYALKIRKIIIISLIITSSSTLMLDSTAKSLRRFYYLILQSNLIS